MENAFKLAAAGRSTSVSQSRHREAIAKVAEQLHERHVKRMAEDAGLSYEEARRLLKSNSPAAVD